MPKITRELNAMQVARLRADGVYAAGGVLELYLRVEGWGSRAWVLRVVVGGQRRRMVLGSLAAVSLAQARAAQGLVKGGHDPIAERQAARRGAALAKAKALTFRRACAMYIAARESEWRNPKHRTQWVNTLATYAEPVLGALDVADIDTADVQRVLEPIWLTKTETATRVRGRIEKILDWATVRGSRSGENPARWRGHLEQLLPQPGKVAKVQHHPAIHVADAPSTVVRIVQAAGVAAQALLLLVLTACRSGEVLGARWSEIDLDRALWVIPAERMKAAREHRIPLSRQAVALLRALPVVVGCDLVFPSRQRDKQLRPLSDMALTQLLRRLRVPCVPHGWRSTFRDWSAETTGYPGEVVEMALAHAIKDKTEAAYPKKERRSWINSENARESASTWSSCVPL